MAIFIMLCQGYKLSTRWMTLILACWHLAEVTLVRFFHSNVALFPICKLHSGRKSLEQRMGRNGAVLPREAWQRRVWVRCLGFACLQDLAVIPLYSIICLYQHGSVAMYFMLWVILWIMLLKFWPLGVLSVLCLAASVFWFFCFLGLCVLFFSGFFVSSTIRCSDSFCVQWYLGIIVYSFWEVQQVQKR